MISKITFTRDDTGESLSFTNQPPFMLTPATRLPAAAALSVSGYESMGAHGGTTLAARFERQAVKIGYNVLESYNNPDGLVHIIAQASRFFLPMKSDLQTITYTMTVYTNDKQSDAYLMRQGNITVPFSAPLLRGQGISVGNEMEFIFDDPYRYWVDGAGVVSGDIYAELPPGVLLGEVWSDGWQTFQDGWSQWTYPAIGTAGTPQTIDVVSSVQVGAEAIIKGAITNPKLTNETDGSYWQWFGTVPAGKSISVNADGVAKNWAGEVIYNSVGRLTAMPGNNKFALSGENISGDGYATVTVRGAF